MKKTLIALAVLAVVPASHAALLGGLLTPILSPLLPGAQQKFLWHVDAAGARVGFAPDGSPMFRLNGGVFAGSAVDDNATVGAGHGVQIGQIKDWWLTISAGGDAAGFDNLQTRLRCNPCRITLADGGVLEAIVDNPATLFPERDIPLDARLLPELGPVSNSDAARPAHMRTTGCIGLREVAWRGKLARTNGTLCLNGVVKFASWPMNRAALGAMTSIALESDSTVTMHHPLKDAITVK
jgi:hypothetical protein